MDAFLGGEEIRNPIRMYSSYCGAVAWLLGQPLVNPRRCPAILCQPERDF
jgi:hypothetical protein